MKRNIIKNICLAQNYSDAAKQTEGFDRSYLYSRKDRHIFDALKQICRNKNKEIQFCIQQDSKTKGFVVYFNIKEDDKNLQISFHTFNKGMIKEFRNNNFVTRWKKNTSSRENADILIERYNLSAEVSNWKLYL